MLRAAACRQPRRCRSPGRRRARRDRACSPRGGSRRARRDSTPRGATEIGLDRAVPGGELVADARPSPHRDPRGRQASTYSPPVIGGRRAASAASSSAGTSRRSARSVASTSSVRAQPHDERPPHVAPEAQRGRQASCPLSAAPRESSAWPAPRPTAASRRSASASSTGSALGSPRSRSAPGRRQPEGAPRGNQERWGPPPVSWTTRSHDLESEGFRRPGQRHISPQSVRPSRSPASAVSTQRSTFPPLAFRRHLACATGSNRGRGFLVSVIRTSLATGAPSRVTTTSPFRRSSASAAGHLCLRSRTLMVFRSRRGARGCPRWSRRPGARTGAPWRMRRRSTRRRGSGSGCADDVLLVRIRCARGPCRAPVYTAISSSSISDDGLVERARCHWPWPLCGAGWDAASAPEVRDHAGQVVGNGGVLGDTGGRSGRRHQLRRDYQAAHTS